MKWNILATEKSLKKTIAALKEANIESIIVENGVDAKKKVLELLPKNAEVMTMSSLTLDAIGVSEAVNGSKDYHSVKNKLNKLNRETEGREMHKIGSAPDWTIGSVHAVTEDGKVVIASNTGSQLPAYAYGAAHVIWVVGTQKIVSNLDDAMTRIYDYILPLESVRLNKQYNMTTGSFVSKLLIVNKEFFPQRITIIFVKEKLGF